MVNQKLLIHAIQRLIVEPVFVAPSMERHAATAYVKFRAREACLRRWALHSVVTDKFDRVDHLSKMVLVHRPSGLESIGTIVCALEGIVLDYGTIGFENQNTEIGNSQPFLYAGCTENEPYDVVEQANPWRGRIGEI